MTIFYIFGILGFDNTKSLAGKKFFTDVTHSMYSFEKLCYNLIYLLKTLDIRATEYLALEKICVFVAI